MQNNSCIAAPLPTLQDVGQIKVSGGRYECKAGPSCKRTQDQQNNSKLRLKKLQRTAKHLNWAGAQNRQDALSSLQEARNRKDSGFRV